MCLHLCNVLCCVAEFAVVHKANGMCFWHMHYKKCCWALAVVRHPWVAEHCGAVRAAAPVSFAAVRALQAAKPLAVAFNFSTLLLGSKGRVSAALMVLISQCLTRHASDHNMPLQDSMMAGLLGLVSKGLCTVHVHSKTMVLRCVHYSTAAAG